MKYKEGLRNCSRFKGPKGIQWLDVTHDLGFSFAEMDVILTVGEIPVRSMGYSRVLYQCVNFLILIIVLWLWKGIPYFEEMHT